MLGPHRHQCDQLFRYQVLFPRATEGRKETTLPGFSIIMKVTIKKTENKECPFHSFSVSSHSAGRDLSPAFCIRARKLSPIVRPESHSLDTPLKGRHMSAYKCMKR